MGIAALYGHDMYCYMGNHGVGRAGINMLCVWCYIVLYVQGKVRALKVEIFSVCRVFWWNKSALYNL